MMIKIGENIFSFATESITEDAPNHFGAKCFAVAVIEFSLPALPLVLLMSARSFLHRHPHLATLDCLGMQYR